MEQAGFDVLVAVESDPIHALTHKWNFPQTNVLASDATTIRGSDILAAASGAWDKRNPLTPFPGQIDAVVGGPPCQGFSVGGVRRVGDDRNQQLLNFVRLVVELRPRVFALENVAGLLEGRFDPLRSRAFHELAEAGYTMSGQSRTVNAADFGVPQNRRRLVVLGSLSSSAPILVEAGSKSYVSDALEGLPDIRSYRRLLRADSAALNEGDQAAMQSIEGDYARTLHGLSIDAGDFADARIWDPSILSNSLRTVHTARTIARFARTPNGKAEPVSRLYRLEPGSPARTLRAGTGSDGGSHTSPRPIHPVYNRVITVREAARIHSFPDWFRFHATNWHGHRQVGNSVPPLLGRAIGSALLSKLDREPQTGSGAQSLGDLDWLGLNSSESLKVLGSLDGNA